MDQRMFGIRVRLALAVYVACFAAGAYNHAMDFWRDGWRPYAWGPAPLELFWTSLLVLDALVVALILRGWRRAGLALASAVMITDVAANTYAWHALNLPAFATAVPLQAAFLGFVLGSAPFLWPERGSPGARARRETGA